MDDLTVIHVHHIMEAASLVHSQGQRTVLVLVTEGKFHLIAVSLVDWASLDAFKYIVLAHTVQQSLDLLLFDL